MRQKGFTLIELLIVMFIIGVLATMLGSNYITSQRRARNARKIADIKKIQQGFEQYYADSTTYSYETCAAMTASTQHFPQKPDISGYICNVGAYTCLCAPLEIVGGFARGANSNNSACSYDVNAPNSVDPHFCVSSLQ